MVNVSRDVSDHSAHRPKAKLLRIELSDLHISEEDSVEPRRDQVESQLLETKDFANEDPVFMPVDVPCVVHSPKQETPRISELWHRSWQSNGTRMIQTRWRLVIQAFMRSFVVEYITKAIKSALLCAKGCRRRIQHILFQRPMHSLVPAILLRPAWLNALVHDPELHPTEREFRQPQQPSARKWRSIIRSNPCRHSILAHGRFTDRSDLT